jgi:predicted nucleotide-binding protein (sugar kinase/HSP70/actin superfamily)
MIDTSVKKISFPHMGNYFTAFEPLARLVAGEVIEPPPISKQTIELGYKHSPECVCVPFKYNLGNYIEALERGANILVQAGGGCRFGYYGEVQETILKKMGYKFEFLKLANSYSPITLAKDFRSLNPKLTYAKIFRTIVLTYLRLHCLDNLEDFVRKNIGFEKQKGEFEKIHKSFLQELLKTNSWLGVHKLRKKYTKIFHTIPIDKPTKPLRVGIVGELYVLMEPFSNFQIEKELAKKGIEVHRFVTVSSILHDCLDEIFFSRQLRKLIRESWPYLKFHLGAHGTESVAKTLELIKDGFDGIIHIKPFGCMPEVNAMSALHKISKDYEFPIIYFSFDAQSSETGIKTRLEAFYDMLTMKKRHDAK